MSRSPSTQLLGRPAKKLGPFRMSDEYRKPFPGLEPRPGQAKYELTPLGRVYRDDGFLLHPRASDLKVQLHGGAVYRSVPAAVYALYGLISKGASYFPWVSPLTPQDPVTGRRSCRVRHVKLVHRGDLIRLGRGTIRVEQIQTFKIR